MYSVIINGEVKDYEYRKHSLGYTFFIGNRYLGIVCKDRFKGWVAIPSAKRYNFMKMHGFRTRFDASEYLLIYMGLRDN